ncbi:MAG: hypothetical protein KAS32_29560 [Candidatus Peribacteraceae bacterium]|nr:hypothetical protein [Candidatus Peribacteraceae bacterium]
MNYQTNNQDSKLGIGIAETIIGTGSIPFLYGHIDAFSNYLAKECDSFLNAPDLINAGILTLAVSFAGPGIYNLSQWGIDKFKKRKLDIEPSV